MNRIKKWEGEESQKERKVLAVKNETLRTVLGQNFDYVQISNFGTYNCNYPSTPSYILMVDFTIDGQKQSDLRYFYIDNNDMSLEYAYAAKVNFQLNRKSRFVAVLPDNRISISKKIPMDLALYQKLRIKNGGKMSIDLESKDIVLTDVTALRKWMIF